ncbi:hypothetical protein MGP2080_01080 [marine gamma proteobacterium HTCC2080]|nr:hypothetical protein MGP2080_01080 [marine gamma proteobacterium HTCC2080]
MMATSACGLYQCSKCFIAVKHRKGVMLAKSLSQNFVALRSYRSDFTSIKFKMQILKDNAT